MAPLELTLALPILMVLLSLIFGICSVAQTRMMVTTAARNSAFEKRHDPWQHQVERLELADVGRVSKILGPNPIKMPANSGLVSGKAEGSPQDLFGPLKLLNLSGTSQRFVLGGRWDYEEIEFEKHAALTITDKANYFGMAADELNSFKRIASLGGTVAGGSLAALQAGSQSRIQQSMAAISQRIQRVEAELRALDRELNEQKRRLASLERSNPPNTEAIRQVKNKVADTAAKIEELKLERSLQNYARNSMNVQFDAPSDAFAGLADQDGKLQPKDLRGLTDQAVRKHRQEKDTTEAQVKQSEQGRKFLKQQAANSSKN